MPEGIIIYWYGNMLKPNITNTNYRPAEYRYLPPSELQLAKNTNNLQFSNLTISNYDHTGTSFFETVDVTGYTKMCSIASANPRNYSAILLSTNMIDGFETICKHDTWNEAGVVEYKEVSIQYNELFL